VAGVGVLVMISTTLISSTPSTGSRGRPVGQLDPRLRPALVLMAVMTMFAGGSANSAIAFAVIGAVERGIDVGPAGVLLAVGSAAGAVTRIVIGRVVDNGDVSALLLIRTAFMACVLGLCLMAIPMSVSYVAGFLLTAALGWGWPGLMHYFVSRLAPHATAAATGIVQTGTYIGSAVGPVLTGVVLSIGGSTATWLMLSALAAVAVSLSFLVGHRLRGIGLAQ